MTPGSRANCSVLDCTNLQVEDDGCFEIRLGPERPAGYTGNFMQTRVTRTSTLADGRTQSREYVAQFIVLRELFYDWAREELLELFIHRVDRLGRVVPRDRRPMERRQTFEQWMAVHAPATVLATGAPA